MVSSMIRQGNRDDLTAIAGMSREFWQNTIYREEEYQPEAVSNLVSLCMEQGLLAVAEAEGKVIGFACAFKVGLSANSDVFQATEVGYWVDPEYRERRIGKALIIALEYFAKLQDIKYLNMVVTEALMPSVLESIYTDMDYIKLETIYTKVL